MNEQNRTGFFFYDRYRTYQLCKMQASSSVCRLLMNSGIYHHLSAQLFVK